ncbi:DUF5677 domain-containing protein [Cupriavidus sp. D39]|uniref:DUF5677 domain-containing protein n=1 Tax=Cupriavidus sp. D39 TaxID=2997877 RepID=UPI002270956F|nr:DUF5677 domain-containing protein [Cupriavidus sp. D39]MCY0852539.1 DUF5677 domain-containing protein [Cupriavidus sp. D39]
MANHERYILSSPKTMAEAGYLSGTASVVRELIRQQFGALLGECAIASRTAMAVLGEGISGPPHQRVALAAWQRSICACQAAVLLAERGMVVEAASILRTGFEHLFYARALLVDPGVLERMRDQDTYERQHTVRQALADTDIGNAVSAEQRAALEAVLQQPVGNLRISAYGAAEKGGLAAVYQVAYRQLSLVGTHANYTSIGASFGDSADELQFEQRIDDLPVVLRLIRDCLKLGSEAFLTLQTQTDEARPTI